ncbi:hypothetical protein FY528_07390 [Hymenobacter lutimineralis]|uniref:GyrI-like domain-containing protein n=1 Tax=Hymenobacter lutimineralis TaxID=2606448 RepID=A0A5D6V7I8_9BACT|nr:MULTISPECIES: hypothetical protein [Hymenobacter]QIX61485.1 hypothetical protein HER32_09975 [Hymenobacter sp. BT18]TYZ11506.1 hypothetical protein FY528_07390 [Hymenobacter lutimineralis]
MNRWFLLLSLAVIATVAGIYAYLGGFTTAEVELLTTKEPIFLAGRYFQGRADSKDFGPLFRQAHQLQESGQLRGDLGNVYYNDPEAAGDTVKAFVGLIVADTTSQTLPTGYRYSTFSGGQRVVRARVQASYMVAPDKLYSGIKHFAEQEKIKLGKVYVERFPAQGPVEVLALVK